MMQVITQERWEKMEIQRLKSNALLRKYEDCVNGHASQAKCNKALEEFGAYEKRHKLGQRRSTYYRVVFGSPTRKEKKAMKNNYCSPSILFIQGSYSFKQLHEALVYADVIEVRESSKLAKDAMLDAIRRQRATALLVYKTKELKDEFEEHYAFYGGVHNRIHVDDLMIGDEYWTDLT